MSFIRLIFTLLAASYLLLPTRVTAAEAVSDCTLESISQSGDRPQWRDIGMCDVLAVTGGSTVAPPTTVRVANNSPSGTNSAVQTTPGRHCSLLRLAVRRHRRSVSGYIYLMIRCLKL